MLGIRCAKAEVSYLFKFYVGEKASSQLSMAWRKVIYVNKWLKNNINGCESYLICISMDTSSDSENDSDKEVWHRVYYSL